MKIHRYQIPVTDRQVIKLPWPSRILSAAPARTGAEHIDLWFVDPGPAPENARTVLGHDFRGEPVRVPATEQVLVHIAGTGHPIPDDINDDDFVGTCVMDSNLVWHVFARTAFDKTEGQW
jgi:hypothetical protein